MTLTELQKKLDELAGEGAFSVFENAQPGVIGAHLNIAVMCRFDQHESIRCVGDKAVSTLCDARDLIDELIVKIEVARREPELIPVKAVKAYLVGCEYWVNAEDYMALEDYTALLNAELLKTMTLRDYVLLRDRPGLDVDGVLIFKGQRVVYKPELD